MNINPDPAQHGLFGVSGSGDTSGYGGLVRIQATPGSSERPYGGYFDDLADSLERAYPEFNEAIEKVVVDRGELSLHIRPDKLVAVAKILRDELLFEMSMGVTGVHYPNDAGRELHAIYTLLSITKNQRVKLEVSVPSANPHLPSLTGIWASNNWHEREAFDMFGLIFDDHPGLTRILMPDDWPGHPQLKDYPLGGIPVEYKGATIPPPDERRAYR
ncbi:MAG TPA: NADH-quinone oxidoreductase subunit C [Candidatus Nanopelagicaceae bacterium]|nr:NADH-quinone oxidoreductase subunit C [Candidatus Nanopelagicaceae bacterium]